MSTSESIIRNSGAISTHINQVHCVMTQSVSMAAGDMTMTTAACPKVQPVARIQLPNENINNALRAVSQESEFSHISSDKVRYANEVLNIARFFRTYRHRATKATATFSTGLCRRTQMERRQVHICRTRIIPSPVALHVSILHAIRKE